LVALAAGSRISELAALDRAAVAFNVGSVNIPVRVGFLFKNQSLNRCPDTLSFFDLPEDLSICPVLAWRHFLGSTAADDHRNHNFHSPVSGKPLNAASLGSWLTKSIRMLVPGSGPRAHDVRKVAFSLAWARGSSMQSIVKHGFWASPNTFISKYLSDTDCSLPCVAGRERLS
jgi:hypothetical protein